jgi:hypothetical protein
MNGEPTTPLARGLSSTIEILLSYINKISMGEVSRGCGINPAPPRPEEGGREVQISLYRSWPGKEEIHTSGSFVYYER